MDVVTTDEAMTVKTVSVMALLTHRCCDLIGEALCTEWLLRVPFVIPEGGAELVLIALEAQLLAEVAVLVFQLRGSLFQVAEVVHDFINVLFGFTVLETLPELEKLLRDLTRSLRDRPGRCDRCNWFHEWIVPRHQVAIRDLLRLGSGLRGVLRMADRDDVLQPFLAVALGDVPVLHEQLDQFDQKLSFVRTDIDDDVDVLLHVRADVAYLTDRVNSTPGQGVGLIPDRLNLVHEPAPRYTPEVSPASSGVTALLRPWGSSPGSRTLRCSRRVSVPARTRGTPLRSKGELGSRSGERQRFYLDPSG